MWTFLFVISFLVFLVSLVTLLFKSTRRKSKWTAAASLVVLIVALAVKVNEQEDEAIRLGFTGAADQRDAKQSGVTDPAAWRTASEAKQQAEAKRQVAAKQLEDERSAAAQTAKAKAATEESASALTLRSAHALCAGLKATGLLTDECKVSAWNQTVEATVDVTSTLANVFCTMSVEQLRGSKLKFEPGWRLKVYSPYSGDRTTALCDLVVP